MEDFILLAMHLLVKVLFFFLGSDPWETANVTMFHEIKKTKSQSFFYISYVKVFFGRFVAAEDCKNYGTLLPSSLKRPLKCFRFEQVHFWNWCFSITIRKISLITIVGLNVSELFSKVGIVPALSIPKSAFGFEKIDFQTFFQKKN